MTENIRFLAVLQVVTYDEAAMRRVESFRKQKIKIGRTDLRIAATAIERNAVVVTENVRDFQQVPGLKCERWSKSNFQSQ